MGEIKSRGGWLLQEDTPSLFLKRQVVDGSWGWPGILVLDR